MRRGGVKLEFVRNSFDSIRKFAIRLIRKGKKYSKNSMKINSKFVRFDSTPTIGWSQIFQMLDSFEIRSIRFENLWFDWFERWKIRSIPIRGLNDSHSLIHNKTLYQVGVESNWNSFEIRSIRFENWRFDWFEKAKKVRKIR